MVDVAGTETAAVCPLWSWMGCFMFGITYCFILYLGVPYVLVMTSFEVVVLVGGSLGAQFGDLPV